MTTIDELSIGIETTAEQVHSELDSVIDKLKDIADGIQDIKNVASKNPIKINIDVSAFKNLNKVKQSIQKSIGNINIDTKKIETALPSKGKKEKIRDSDYSQSKKWTDNQIGHKSDNTYDYNAINKFVNSWGEATKSATKSAVTFEEQIKKIKKELSGLEKQGLGQYDLEYDEKRKELESILIAQKKYNQEIKKAVELEASDTSNQGLRENISKSIKEVEKLGDSVSKVGKQSSISKIAEEVKNVEKVASEVKPIRFVDEETYRMLQNTKKLLQKTFSDVPNIAKSMFSEDTLKMFQNTKNLITKTFSDTFKFAKTSFGNLKNVAQKSFSGITMRIGGLKNSKKEIEDIGGSAKKTKESVSKIGTGTENGIKSLKQLRSEFRAIESELERLKAKSDGWTAKGVSPNSVKFKDLQGQIEELSKKSDALKKKIKEVGETKPNVSGWQKLTALATLIDKSFSAIKRGVSSAVSSIKKLGKGFSSLYSVVKKVSSAIGKMFSSITQLASKATSAVASSVKGMTSAFSKLRGESSGLQKASSGISGLVKAAGSLLAVKGLVDFGKEAVELGSDITEVENVVEAAFGSMADKAYDFAENAASQFGLSELAAKKYSGTMMAMLKSSNVAQDAAAEMSINLAGLAGDLASFYNIDTDTAFQKLRAGISGETEPLKQLGINMNIVNLETYAMSKGITKAYQEMTLAEQTILRYNYILAKTGDAQGDFARTTG